MLKWDTCTPWSDLDKSLPSWDLDKNLPPLCLSDPSSKHHDKTQFQNLKQLRSVPDRYIKMATRNSS